MHRVRSSSLHIYIRSNFESRAKIDDMISIARILIEIRIHSLHKVKQGGFWSLVFLLFEQCTNFDVRKDTLGHYILYMFPLSCQVGLVSSVYVLQGTITCCMGAKLNDEYEFMYLVTVVEPSFNITELCIIYRNKNLTLLRP
jgi:hypothetical protein